ncbi:MAG: TerC/Alx family metal homeostasis membrane protein [Verrucomicrobia bacterium]|nr:TerC/Alx family metal homeostasis membrane protein [Verrucomicrobiota bacterium]
MPALDIVLFPFREYLWFYAGFLAFVFVVLALDLGVFHRKAHAIGMREAAGWSVFWVTLALLFNYGFYLYCKHAFSTDPQLAVLSGFDPNQQARYSALEFLTGFIVEKSLAVDNLFIFVVVFKFFGIPAKYQHKVLFWGILGAIFFRVVFIALGAMLLQIHWVTILLGVFLILTGIKIFFSPDHAIDPATNPVLRFLQRVLPVTHRSEEGKFFLKIDSAWKVTPLMVCLIFIEFCDIVFAVDSVPAIFAITKEPLIVLTSNVFAILGLRALYFLLAGVVDKFHLLKFGLGLVLMFVGLKMAWLNGVFGGKFPVAWSLAIITTLVGGSILCSLLFPAKKPAP